ncbi:hypothetical protein [Shimia sp. SDUM112013]|uniref:hypothetical protein n=1 Tax=Shimia sp. SDUM112013 TaxID=3136160 RepID=UPI0032F091AF
MQSWSCDLRPTTLSKKVVSRVLKSPFQPGVALKNTVWGANLKKLFPGSAQKNDRIRSGSVRYGSCREKQSFAYENNGLKTDAKSCIFGKTFAKSNVCSFVKFTHSTAKMTQIKFVAGVLTLFKEGTARQTTLSLRRTA